MTWQTRHFHRPDGSRFCSVEFEGLRGPPEPGLTYGFKIRFEPAVSADEVDNVLRLVWEELQVAALTTADGQ